MTKLIEIMGIDHNVASRLNQEGIDSAEMLLIRCRLQADRQILSRKLLISRRRLLAWAQQADLLRVNGIGCDYADLLVRINVCTISDLAESLPCHIRERLVQVNNSRPTVKRVPAVSRIQTWIEHAQQLQPSLES